MGKLVIPLGVLICSVDLETSFSHRLSKATGFKRSHIQREHRCLLFTDSEKMSLAPSPTISSTLPSFLPGTCHHLALPGFFAYIFLFFHQFLIFCL